MDAVHGLFRPFLHIRLRAVLIGGFCAVPVYGVTGFFMLGDQSDDPLTMGIVVMGAFLIGSAVGWRLWSKYAREDGEH